MDRPMSHATMTRMPGPLHQAPAQRTATDRQAGNARDAGPVTESKAVKARLAPAGDDGPSTGGTDLEKVAKNGLVSAVAIGGCFGSMTALSKAVLANPKAPLPLKVLVGLLPTASVFPTPWVEDGMRQALVTSPTYPSTPTYPHDCVAAGILFGVSRASARVPLMRKFAPATPTGMGLTVAQAVVASLLAGAGSEVTAQWMNESERQHGGPAAPPPHIDNARKATGRLLSQGPAAVFQTGLTLSGKTLPSHWSRLPAVLVSGGWSCRRLLIPAEAPPTAEPATAIAAKSSDSRTDWGPCNIPPA